MSATLSRLIPGLAGLTDGHRGRQRHVRLLEAVAATAEPAVQRGGASSDPAPSAGASADDEDTGATCASCSGSGVKGGALCASCEGSGTTTPVRESVALNPLTVGNVARLREATAASSPIYEVELLAEGRGLGEGRVFYPAQTLREAANDRIFEGMQAYAMHARRGTPEDREPGNRDLRQLVGYYRNVRFKESGSLGKPALAADLVVSKGQRWFVDLLESAIAARGDGVQLCGVSIDAGGYVERGTVGGQTMNICRKITEAPSADVVSRAAAGGTIVRRLRESVARTQLPKPQEAHTMKVAEFKPKLDAAHTKLRESIAKLVKEGASDEDVQSALKEINDAEGEFRELREAEVEAEKVEVEKLVPVDDTELANVTTKLREAETARDEAIRERDDSNVRLQRTDRSLLAHKVLRESEIPVDSPLAGKLFDELVKLDGEEAMKAHATGVKAYEADMFARFRESLGIGAPPGVEGAGALVPSGAASSTPAGLEQLSSAGIPLTPDPAATA